MSETLKIEIDDGYNSKHNQKSDNINKSGIGKCRECCQLEK